MVVLYQTTTAMSNVDLGPKPEAVGANDAGAQLCSSARGRRPAPAITTLASALRRLAPVPLMFRFFNNSFYKLAYN